MGEGVFKKRIDYHLLNYPILGRETVEGWIDEARKEWIEIEAEMEKTTSLTRPDLIQLEGDWDDLRSKKREDWFLKWFGEPTK